MVAFSNLFKASLIVISVVSDIILSTSEVTLEETFEVTDFSVSKRLA